MSRTASSWGIGKKDYSQNVEYIVEPLIRSYQDKYTNTFSLTDLAAGSSETTNTQITTGKVVFLYDFVVSAASNSLIRLRVQAVDADGTAATIVHKCGYQKVVENIPKGFPFFTTIRVQIWNYGQVAQSFDFYCAGMETDETQYELIQTLPSLPGI